MGVYNPLAFKVALYTASMFKVGEEVKFTYRDKTRQGVVESVNNEFLTLVNMVGEQPSTYKSFRYERMGAVTWFGNVVYV